MTRKTQIDESPVDNQTENGEVSFKWIGSGVKVKRLIHYGKCEVDGVQISVGDNVEIKLEKSTAVAEVRELYETVGDEPHRATVRWYYPLRDIPKKFKTCVEKPNAFELFKPEDGLFIGCEEEIDVETVQDTVTVWEIGEDDTPPAGDYFVKYCFPSFVKQKGKAKLIPILGRIVVEEDKRVFIPKDDIEEESGSTEEEEEGEEEEVEEKGKEVEEEEEEEVAKKKKYTNVKGKVKNEDVENTDDRVNRSGKLKENARKWKNYSADEVLAELWNTDKDGGSIASVTGKKSNLKRKLDGVSTKSNTNGADNNNSNDIMDENVASPVYTKENTSAGVDADYKAKRERDSETNGNHSNNEQRTRSAVSKTLESDLKLNINKNMSPFKSIPKKKEKNAVSVFDFDEMAGGNTPTASSKKKKSVSVKTPKNSSKTPKNDTTKKKGKSEATPGISERKTPRAIPKNMLELARKKLHVSAVPETLPCRDDQFGQIFSFVQDRLKEGTGGCMYISGVPGTGKTATVREVVRTLKEIIDEAVIPDFRFIEINGMKLTDPNQAYVEILKQLEGKKATPDHAADLLSKRFQSGGKNENVVLLVDELDLLCTRKQNVMYNMFDWPTYKNSKLVVLAVANTMDLPERMMMNRVSSRLGLTRMTFQPYTFKELEEIVISRIRGTDAFEDDALQLVARKVAAVSGDARRCLDICRRAVEISEASDTKKAGGKTTVGIVGMKHVDLALREMFSSPKIVALRCLSDMETMFMKAVISEFRRTGLEEAIFLEVYDQFKKHCSLEDGIEPPNMSEAFTICNNLGSCRLLLVEAGNKDVHQRVRLNVNMDDAMFAFKSRGT